MGDTYKAILRGDQIEWTEVVPTNLTSEQPVEVTILDEPGQIAIRRKRMAEALENLAAIDAFSGIANPVEWQREIRRDRPLPGRDG